MDDDTRARRGGEAAVGEAGSWPGGSDNNQAKATLVLVKACVARAWCPTGMSESFKGEGCEAKLKGPSHWECR